MHGRRGWGGGHKQSWYFLLLGSKSMLTRKTSNQEHMAGGSSRTMDRERKHSVHFIEKDSEDIPPPKKRGGASVEDNGPVLAADLEALLDKARSF
ncbi:hypothetical protein NDU88_001789 [Pleurodeles waltl]|uniref:Uncharacterized protein n=1 Tax=Pleurodeles waltl TaxID=8319 RepID=A0AAV7SBE3_PLEWA|nr:hypothetical protein NDU88_001789 [Pleurodeles waltl]